MPKPASKENPDDPGNFRPITLTPCVSKLYTNILRARLTSFLTANQYWSRSTQKGLLNRTPGCIEHQFVLWEALTEAKREQRSIATCWLDFQNAFGSVRHQLIDFALDHYHVSGHFRAIVKNLYSNLAAVVHTKSWTTQVFPIRIRVFQGDPLSVSIFNMVTSLFADSIQQLKFHHAGYTFKSTQDPLLLLLFADVAVLVANSPEKCQELLNQTDNFLDWAKIKAKVVKCRSLAFRKRPKSGFFNPNLNISGQSIPYIGDQDIRFLGLPIDLSLSAHKLKQDLLG